MASARPPHPAWSEERNAWAASPGRATFLLPVPASPLKVSGEEKSRKGWGGEGPHPEPQAVTTDPSQAASPVTPLLSPLDSWYSAASCRAGERKTSTLLLTLRAKSGEAVDAEADLGRAPRCPWEADSLRGSPLPRDRAAGLRRAACGTPSGAACRCPAFIPETCRRHQPGRQRSHSPIP